MNRKSRIAQPALYLRSWIALTGLCLSWSVWSGEAPLPAQAREEALRLEEKAAALRADGRSEAAKDLMVQARKVRAEVAAPEFRGPEPPVPDDARRALRRRLEQLQNELKRSQDEGREAEASELRQQIERLERKARELPHREGPLEFGRGDRPRFPARPHAMEFERRRAHLQRAVENLKAAGLHGLAERLAQAHVPIREMPMRESMGPMGGGGGGVGPDEIERLRAEVRELREGMHALKQRLEEVAQRRP